MNATYPDSVIWATRGRTWGFRFLLDAGLSDPLADYERAFGDLRGAPTASRCAFQIRLGVKTQQAV